MRRVATSGTLLIVAFVLGMGGVVLFVVREELSGPDLFPFERGLLIASYTTAAIGVILLGSALQKLRSTVLVRMTTIMFLLAAALAVTAEASLVMDSFSVGRSFGRAMVVLLYAAGAAIGVALLNGGLVKPWIAWTLILWNGLWPAALAIFTPDDMYYPALHFLPLILIGIALTAGARSKRITVT